MDRGMLANLARDAIEAVALIEAVLDAIVALIRWAIGNG